MLESKLNRFGADSPLLLALIVLYNVDFNESAAFSTVCTASPKGQPGRSGILLYDNTPIHRDPGPLPVGVQYQSMGQNTGLAAAYNWALTLCEEGGFSWLLLLDQDTKLPADFLQLLRLEIEKHDANPDVVAIVPLVRNGNDVISPKRVGLYGLHALPGNARGIQDDEITCINSGTAVRCSFVRSLGGFNRAYWLDYLDYWLFHQIYASGKKAAVFDCTLEHDLSVTDYARNVSKDRYRSILKGESAFVTTHRPKSQIPFYLLRLLFRSARLAMRRHFDMALFTLSVIAKIALHPMRSLEDGSR